MNILSSIIDTETNDLTTAVNSAREIMQETILSGLSRANFFKHAAFQGGTCLRIFHDLDRFSEDLDFCLTDDEYPLDLEKLSRSVINETRSLGMDLEISPNKRQVRQTVGFKIKGNTRSILEVFGFNEDVIRSADPDMKINIKIDIETDVGDGFRLDHVYRAQPMNYDCTLLDMTSLFAGKTAAVIGRNWKDRFKGRDLYDFEWYVKNNTHLNMRYLEHKLRRDGILTDADFNGTILKDLLKERFKVIDYVSAYADIEFFVDADERPVDWDVNHFIGLLDDLKMD